MVRVIESVQGRYEVQEVPFGKVYAWRPGHFVFECSCGEEAVLNASASACRCGTNHMDAVRQELGTGKPGDEALHPWRCFENHQDRADARASL
jgi:hypothetical protein